MADPDEERGQTPDLLHALRTIEVKAKRTREAVAKGAAPKGSTGLREIELMARDAIRNGDA